MSEKIGIEQWLQRERSEWLSFIFVMNGVMLRLVLLLFYFALFKNLILIIGSPAFAFLSEKTEALLEGKQHHFNWEEVGVDAKRGIRLAIQNSGKELLNFAGLILHCAELLLRLRVHLDLSLMRALLLLLPLRSVSAPEQVIEFRGTFREAR